ncbi:MAG: hypothetical protein WDZ94_05240 [Patescibacteria group bacterium]
MPSLIPTPLANLGSFEPPTQQWSDNTDTDGVLSNMENFLSTIIGLLTVIAAVYFIFNFLIAAVSWVTAGGDSGKIQSARDRIIQSTIGMIVVVAAYGIVGLVGAVLGLEILNPADMLRTIVGP